MKKFWITLGLCFVTAFVADAQFMNTTPESVSKKKLADYSCVVPTSSFRFTYSPANLVTEYKGKSSSQSFNGVGMTYTFCIPCSNSFPLYLQDEFGLRWLSDRDEDSVAGYKYTTSTDFLSATVAMSLKYRIALDGGNIAIEPVAGLDFLGYFLGRSKITYHFTDETRTETVDHFYGTDSDFRYLNFDWHAGAKIVIGKFFILATYEAPFVGLKNKDGYKVGFNMTNLSVGFEF